MVDRISAASTIVYDLRLAGAGRGAPSAFVVGTKDLRGDTMDVVDVDFVAIVARDTNDGRYILDDNNSILVSNGTKAEYI